MRSPARLLLGSALAVAPLSAGFGCAPPAPEKADPKDMIQETETRTAAAAATRAPSPAAPGVRDDGDVVLAFPLFEGALEGALARALAESKLVLVDVGAYWCHSCHELDEAIFTRPEVGEHVAARYVALKIDAEKDEGPDLVARYKVQAYPTLLVLDPSGVERGRVVEVADAAELLTALAEIEAGGDPLAALAAAAAAAPDDLEARYRLGLAYALAAKRAEAAAAYAAVLSGDPDNARGLAAKVLYDQAAFFAAKQDGDPEAAIARYRELQARFPGSREAIRAHRAIGRELHRLGRDDEAIASLEAMIAAAPGDVALKASYGWFSFRERCRPADGLRAVEAGLAAAPEDAELHYLRAELAHLVGDDTKALESVRRAAAIEPKTAFYRRQVRRFEGLGAAAGDLG
ncbi:MAG: tetratricopeptide repeat protein [Myxococcales bacterium]|nr:tetratricopeptide repeat protein [Myxococcales bacterium]